MLKVLLVSNYVLDKQPSMLNFSQVLATTLGSLGVDVQIIRPEPFMGRCFKSSAAVTKYLGYIDKFLLFIPPLLQAAKWANVVHICDHSNAMYVLYLQNKPHLITCHDLLAVRAALGENTYSQPSATGIFLQKWILSSLRQFKWIVCDSTYTSHDVNRLLVQDNAATNSKKIKVVPLGLNYHYQVLSANDCLKILSELEIFSGHNISNLSCPYILHVGGSSPRKNRDGILRVFSLLADKWEGNMIFAGQPLPNSLWQLAQDLQIKHRVIEIVDPNKTTLEALYNRAYALLFPSRFEGFGWPIIEAQACGCPVVCSTCGPFEEITAGSALMRQVDDEVGLANDLLSLRDPRERRTWVNRGLENVKRFSPERMTLSYLEIYKELLCDYGITVSCS